MRALLLLLLLSAPVHAGPWPRARGEVYVLSQHETGSDWSALYAEWGGPLGLTFGLDAGGEMRAMADPRAFAKARLRVFAARPLPDLGAWRWAVEGGVGLDLAQDADRDGAPETRRVPRMSVGLSVGRGLRWGGADGWATAGLRTEVAKGAARRDTLGVKFGWKPTPRDTLELSLYAERADGTAHWTAGPFYQRRVGRIGLRGGVVVTEAGEARLRLGVATEF